MNEERVKQALASAEELNGELNAFLSIEKEHALARAAGLEDTGGQIHGTPIAIKDNICTRGMRTGCGSRILEGYQPPYDATAVVRLKNAGAVIIGKTNMDEFAMGSSNENSAYGPARNPWNPEHVPGGSSGGSAVAVASGIVDVALGSETGGSVRQPASFCGVTGLKPTYGRVSRYGLVAFASSLDQIGVFGSNAARIAEVLSVIAGRDENDATTAEVEVPDYRSALDQDISGKRLGVPRSLFGKGLDDEVREEIEKGIGRFRDLGAEIVDIELPHSKYSIAVYYIIATAEASSNLARFDGVRYGYRSDKASELREMYMKTRDEGFGQEVKRRILLGTYVLSSGYYDAYYAKAQKVRTLIKKDFAQSFEKCDAIVTPTSPTTAFGLGERVDDPLAMYLSDIYTASANLVGIPGISIPCAISGSGLPIGLQLLGNHWSEGLLLNLAAKFETVASVEARPRLHVSAAN